VRLLFSMILALVAVTALVPVLRGLVERDTVPLSLKPDSTGRSHGDSISETDIPPIETKTETGYLYIWRDKDGVHIESVQPPEGVQAELVPFERSVVVEQAPAETDVPHSPAAIDGSLSDPGRTPISVYTPEGFEQLLEHIDRTADQLKAREELLESLQNDL
jgi:hypothetical protein